MHSQKVTMHITPESREITTKDMPTIKAVDINLAVADKLLLKDINLTLKGKGITVLLGANGAGKSLLLRILHGLVKPSSGQLLWNHQPVVNITQYRQQQALVFQKPVLLRRSVKANIDFVLSLQPQYRGFHQRKLRHQKSLQLLTAAGLAMDAKTPARLLSGGEQQRLALCRALAINPTILFLDEATASLDPASTKRIEQQIKQVVTNGIRVVMVSHDIKQAKRLADEIIFLHQGRLLEQSNARAFFEEPQTTEAKDYLSGKIFL